MNRREFVSMLGASAAVAGLPARGEAAKPGDEKFWEDIRKQFLQPDGVIYLNNGSIGLSPRPVVDAMIKHLRESESFKDREYPKYPWWGYADTTLEFRTRIAAFLGADPDEIALTRNATEGMNTVASGLDLQPGDEVLISDQEHPGGRSPWLLRAKRYGIVVKMFEMPVPPKSPAQILNRINDAITPRTKVISVSHITTVTGGMLPAKELSRLARDKGIISLIDGAHSMGQLPLNLHDLGCDYFATSPHKWLFAPKGTGVLYCRKGMADRLWSHTAAANWDRPELGVERLSTIGTSNVSLLVGLDAAMNFFNKIGPDTILKRHHHLANYVRDHLARIPKTSFMSGPPPDLATAMVKVALPTPTFTAQAAKIWNQHKIWFNASNGNDKTPASIRFSCPYYMLPRHIDKAIEVLKRELA